MISTGSNGADVGVSRVTSEMAKVIAQVPPVIESLTELGVDQLVERLSGTAAGDRPITAVVAPDATKR
jgi:ABC-type proline/glycine betaine transport system permease subunit